MDAYANNLNSCCSHGISWGLSCILCQRYISYPSWNYWWPTVATVYKCPVCEGRGNVSKGFYERREVEEKGIEKCRRCCGVGTIS